MKRYLIVGLGSIGQRHLRNLRNIEPDSQIAVLHLASKSRHFSIAEPQISEFFSIADALAFQPEAAIIACPAPFHFDVAMELVANSIHVMIEKPLTAEFQDMDPLIELARSRQCHMALGYNLRHLDSIKFVHQLIQKKALGNVWHANFEVGQFLPNWRKGQDYRDTASAKSSLGGGVLLELSHEIDLIQWFFGMPDSIHAVGGKISLLDIDTEDLASCIFSFTQGLPAVVALHMDFLQRKPTRSAKFICADGEIVWDGIRNKVEIFKGDDGSEQMLYDQFSVSIEGTYEVELAEFLHHCFEGTPSQDQIVHGQKVMKLIDQLRQSITTNRTVRT